MPSSTTVSAHNGLGLTSPLDPEPRGYHDRPFRVIDAGRFAEALRATIADPRLRTLPPAGAVDQLVDSTDGLGDLRLLREITTARLARG